MIEIEAKYIVPDQMGCDIILKAVEEEDWKTNSGKNQHLVNTYLDTIDKDLLKARLACRLRDFGGHYELSIKSDVEIKGALSVREEVTQHLSGVSDPFVLPEGEIIRRINSIIGEKTLLPMFKIITDRVVWCLRRIEETEIEMVLDRVTLERKDGSSQGLPVWRELELELKKGAPSIVSNLGERISRKLGIKPESRSKFARAVKVLKVSYRQ